MTVKLRTYRSFGSNLHCSWSRCSINQRQTLYVGMTWVVSVVIMKRLIDAGAVPILTFKITQ